MAQSTPPNSSRVEEPIQVIVAIMVLSLAGPLVWRVLRRRPPAAEDAGATQ